MSRVTKTTAYTGAVLALALTLTGCNGGGTPGGNSTSASASQSSLAPIEDVSSSANVSSSSASSSSTSASSSSASASSSALPEYKPVTSKKPGGQEEAKASAFKAVELLYTVSSDVLNSGDAKNADRLSVAAQQGELTQQKANVEKTLATGATYRGASKVELIDGLAGPSVHADGTLVENASVNLRVCEDNSGVKITGKDGKPVDTGATQRFIVKYAVLWNEDDGVWSVVSSELPPLNGPEETSC
ncbi:hypothetical protein BL166_00028060 [Klebsiella pneumoniae]|mgnify:FL=1|nr:hypothetical protein BL166_00028060 [Klebsiella pneumoniae]